LSAAASITAVAVVLTLVLADNPLQPQPQIAAVTKPDSVVQAVTLPQPVPASSQRRVNEYLMAHQEFSPSTALQGVAPYVRTVSAPRDGSPR
jgi:sigma-E factor negative regulatory protein RseA